MKSSNSSTTVLELVNSKRRLLTYSTPKRDTPYKFKLLISFCMGCLAWGWNTLMSTTNVAEESGFLHRYFSYGSNCRLNVLLLVILRLLKKYPGWRRIEAAYTAVSSVSYLSNLNQLVKIRRLLRCLNFISAKCLITNSIHR